MEIKGNNLYDANKQLVLDNEKPLTHLELARKQEMLEDFFKEEVVEYAMLLCHDRRDYTVFHLNGAHAAHVAASEALGCCIDRGEILGVDLTDNKDAYEIWLKVNNEAFCYYLFPYDQAVIECDQESKGGYSL